MKGPFSLFLVLSIIFGAPNIQADLTESELSYQGAQSLNELKRTLAQCKKQLTQWLATADWSSRAEDGATYVGQKGVEDCYQDILNKVIPDPGYHGIE